MLASINFSCIILKDTMQSLVLGHLLKDSNIPLEVRRLGRCPHVDWMSRLLLQSVESRDLPTSPQSRPLGTPTSWPNLDV